MYKISGNSIFRLTDSANIPKDIGNRDYVQYLEWVDEGNQPEPEFTEAELATRQRNAIGSRRYDAEVAGMSINGLTVYTDRDTQNKLTAAAVRASRNAAYSVDWKCVDGTFITLNAEQIIAVADTVGDYVQACYTREFELATALNDGTYTDDMLEQGWPATV